MAGSLIVKAVVFLFDLIAFGLAVAAEQRRSKAHVQADSAKEYDYCVYDSDIATGYGVGALLLLLGSQALVMFATKCFCCGRALHPGGSRACALILFLFSWLTFVIAEACLLAGSVRNAYHTRYRGIFNGDPLSCETVRKGVFAAGAAFVFFTALLNQFYYFTFAKTRDNAAYAGSNINMTPIPDHPDLLLSNHALP